MHADLHDHVDELQRACALATPAARLRMIRQRLASAQGETGSMRLVTVVSAVEALARSLVVHSSGRPASTAEMRHRQFRVSGPAELVEEVLRLRDAGRPASHFGAENWSAAAVSWPYGPRLAQAVPGCFAACSLKALCSGCWAARWVSCWRTGRPAPSPRSMHPSSCR